MMALRELLCYCHIVGPRHLRPLVRWGDHYGYVPIGPCWKACTRFRVRDSQGPFVRLGSRDWGVELPYTKLHVSHATRWGLKIFVHIFIVSQP